MSELDVNALQLFSSLTESQRVAVLTVIRRLKSGKSIEEIGSLDTTSNNIVKLFSALKEVRDLLHPDLTDALLRAIQCEVCIAVTYNR